MPRASRSIDDTLDPYDRLYAAVLRQAVLDAKSGETRYAAPARAFLARLGVPLDARGEVEGTTRDWSPADLLSGWSAL
jgi:hypothetical protein